MATKFLPNGIRPIVSFTSTLGVGSTWTSTNFSTLQFQSYVGICAVDSSNIIVSFDQSTNSGTNWDVTSTVAVAITTKTLDFTTYGNVGRVRITTINSSEEEAIRLVVYGVPTT